MRRMAAALTLAAALVGCGGGGSDADESSDAPAEMACMHFRNVAGDAASGLLTDDELRSKLQEVHDDARLADTAEIREQSEAMLAAVTQRDSQRASEAIEAFSAACAELDY